MNSILRAAAILVPVLAVAACYQQGPAERAGQSLDNAAAQTRDTIDPPHNALESTGRAVDRAVEPGPGERAGRAIDRTTR